MPTRTKQMLTSPVSHDVIVPFRNLYQQREKTLHVIKQQVNFLTRHSTEQQLSNNQITTTTTSDWNKPVLHVATRCNMVKLADRRAKIRGIKSLASRQSTTRVTNQPVQHRYKPHPFAQKALTELLHLVGDGQFHYGKSVRDYLSPRDAIQNEREPIMPAPNTANERDIQHGMVVLSNLEEYLSQYPLYNNEELDFIQNGPKDDKVKYGNHGFRIIPTQLTSVAIEQQQKEKELERRRTTVNMRKLGKAGKILGARRVKIKKKRFQDLLSKTSEREYSLIRVASAEHIASYPKPSRLPIIPVARGTLNRRELCYVVHDKKQTPEMSNPKISAVDEIKLALKPNRDKPIRRATTSSTIETDNTVQATKPVLVRSNTSAVADAGEDTSCTLEPREVLVTEKEYLKFFVDINPKTDTEAIQYYNMIRTQGHASLSVRHRYLRSIVLRAAFQAIGSNQYIVDLDISGNSIDYNAASSLSFFVLREDSSDRTPTSPSASMKYKKTKDTSGPIKFLGFQMAPVQCCIKALDLSNTKLSSKSVATLCNVLRSNTTLRQLSLRDNALGDDSVKRIAKLLLGHSSIVKLDVSGNAFTSRCSNSWAEVLQKNNMLHTFGYAWNSLGDVGGSEIFAQLTLNGMCNLQCLDFSFTGLGDQTGEKLAKLLSKNRSLTLTSLNLSHNRLTSVSGKLLAKAMKGNTHLKYFRIGFNPLGREQSIKLIKAIQKHPTLEVLGVECTSALQTTNFKYFPNNIGTTAANETPNKLDFDQRVPQTQQDQFTWEVAQHIKYWRQDRGISNMSIQVEFPEQPRQWQFTCKFPNPFRRGGRPTPLPEEMLTRSRRATVTVVNTTLESSVFAGRNEMCDSNDFFDTKELIQDAFLVDWNRILPKIQRSVKSVKDLARLKNLLQQNYESILNIFQWYAGKPPSPNFMTLGEFKEFLVDSRLISPFASRPSAAPPTPKGSGNQGSPIHPTSVETIFIAANLDTDNVVASNELNPDRSFTRYEFMEAIFRVAMGSTYLKERSNISGALEQVLCKHIIPNARAHNSNQFRSEVLYVVAVDQVFHAVLPQISFLFHQFVDSDIHAAAAPMMSYETGFVELVQAAGITEPHSPCHVPLEAVAQAFTMANMVVRDELDVSRSQIQRDLPNKLTYTEFLEACVRLAYSHMTLNGDETSKSLPECLVSLLRALFSINRRNKSLIWNDFFEKDPWESVDLCDMRSLMRKEIQPDSDEEEVKPVMSISTLLKSPTGRKSTARSSTRSLKSVS